MTDNTQDTMRDGWLATAAELEVVIADKDAEIDRLNANNAELRDELFKNVREVKSSSDMSVNLVFASCRSAQEFRQKADAICLQGGIK